MAFTDGVVVNKEWIVISSHLLSLGEEADHTRLHTYKNGEWLWLDLNMSVRSLCVQARPSTSIYCLGRDGRISIRRPPQGPLEERIPDAGTGRGKFGYVHTVRQIDGSLYVCGVSGQIYRREKTGWTHFDDGVLQPPRGTQPADLYCIDGSSATDIYAVGEKGLLWHHDGRLWTRLETLTTGDLNWVKCVSPTEVYICGGAGSVFRGHRGSWENFSVPTRVEEEFWCVEIFKGKPFLAGNRRLYTVENRKVVPINTELSPDPDGNHLYANDGVLWSFGSYHLCFFDGKKWTYVKHPDSPE